ncbi:MAG: phage portal protein [Streptosporangiales bacterium]
MANLLSRLRRPSRSLMDSGLEPFTIDGNTYVGLAGAAGVREERPSGDFVGLVQGAYRRSGVVSACMLARMLIFSEARFQWQRMHGGQPGDLFGTEDLAVLERPWTGGRTSDLLARMIQDADLSGNAFFARRGDTLRRLRPDWVTIITGSEHDATMTGDDIDAELIGYMYQPAGPGSTADAEILAPDEVAHFAPIPDPLFHYRGMSWLTPILREVAADNAATTHKLKFFEQGATPQLVVSLDASVTPDMFERFKAKMDTEHAGVSNAYKTMYLGGGADVTVAGKDLRELDFRATQGAGETRVAAASGTPPIIVGFSEGLQSATYSNYGQARRRFADGTLHPLWRAASAGLESVAPPPAGARLWFDKRDIPFLQEDRKDAAQIQGTKAQTVRTLIDAGYEPETVTAAVEAEDMSLLRHTGLFSVQLQPPGTAAQAIEAPPEESGDNQ